MVDESKVTSFLRELSSELFAKMPFEQQAWTNCRIERKEGNCQIIGGNAPSFGVILNHPSLRFHSVAKFVSELQSDPRYNALPAGYWTQPELIAVKIATDYFRRVSNLGFAPAEADAIAAGFLRSLEAKSSLAMCFAVVLGLTMGFEEHWLTSTVRIRKLSDGDVVDYFGGGGCQIPISAMSFDMCIMEIHSSVPAGHVACDIHITAQKVFNDITAALLLVKFGCVTWQSMWVRGERTGQLPFVEYGSGMSTDALHLPTYSLAKSDIRELQTMFEFLPKAGRCPPLSTAITRVNSAAQRTSVADQIVDLLIALEALFGDGPGAIGYKVALRCAKFIEDSVESRLRVNDIVRKLFDKRHKIVHGATSNNGDISPEQVGQLFSVVQKSIQRLREHVLSSGRIPTAKEFDTMLLS